MKKWILRTLLLVSACYIVLCGLLYIFQEKTIFFPDKLAKEYTFDFDASFQEIKIKAKGGKLLDALLFKADTPKGLIFYLHGNAGNLSSCGEVAKTYTDLHYDVFILDFRGYGKSEGKITSENQLFEDDQAAYSQMKLLFSEDSIVILGYSIGTGLAAKLAATNHPKLLILQAPYYNLTDMMKRDFPIIPTFLLNYKLATNKYLKKVRAPIVIFHGTTDEVIYFGSSLKLKEDFGDKITLIPLQGQQHNGMTENPAYKAELSEILNSR